MAENIDKEKLENIDGDQDQNVANEEEVTADANEQVASEDDAQEDSTDENSKENELDEVEKLKAEVQEAKDKYLRLYSEFENFRRRTAKEKLDLIKTAGEELMVALLPVIDDFQRAQKALEESEDHKTSKEGFDLIYNKFYKVLDQKGLKAMDVKAGSEFDTEFHEAISQMPVEKKKMKGKVFDGVEKGYLLDEKVIRFAKVVIGA